LPKTRMSGQLRSPSSEFSTAVGPCDRSSKRPACRTPSSGWSATRRKLGSEEPEVNQMHWMTRSRRSGQFAPKIQRSGDIHCTREGRCVRAAHLMTPLWPSDLATQPKHWTKNHCGPDRGYLRRICWHRLTFCSFESSEFIAKSSSLDVFGLSTGLCAFGATHKTHCI
jgi:hypothetical protein